MPHEVSGQNRYPVLDCHFLVLEPPFPVLERPFLLCPILSRWTGRDSCQNLILSRPPLRPGF